MGMRLHELHASSVHTPLGLLPAAAAFDFVAAIKRDRSLSRTGLRLWWGGVAGAMFAELSGLAASQEVRAYEKKQKDAMLIHGWGNTLVGMGALGLALWRTRHRPTVASALVGAAACAAAVFTAYLGGEMVYAGGVGVRPAGGVMDSPDVLSLRAPVQFVRDAVRGMGWALREGAKLVSREQPANVMEISEP